MLLRSALAAVLAFGASNSAEAHAALVRSQPGSRAVLQRAPERIELCFNEAVEPKFSSLRIERKPGSVIPVGDLVSSGDAKCISVLSPSLEPGVYTVHYRVLSRDGHVIEYGYQFTIKPDAQ